MCKFFLLFPYLWSLSACLPHIFGKFTICHCLLLLKCSWNVVEWMAEGRVFFFKSFHISLWQVYRVEKSGRKLKRYEFYEIHQLTSIVIQCTIRTHNKKKTAYHEYSRKLIFCGIIEEIHSSTSTCPCYLTNLFHLLYAVLYNLHNGSSIHISTENPVYGNCWPNSYL